MTIDTDGIDNVNSNNFVDPWTKDPKPIAPQSQWGMDTSNVAAINDTHGVVYSWEIWRGASDGSIVNRGNAVASITLGGNKPIATRVGPLLTGPNALQLGLLAVMRQGAYIYVYAKGGPTNIVVGRVRASDDVFDSSKYKFLEASDYQTWSNPAADGGVPTADSMVYGMKTANPGGKFGCDVYGSVFYNKYLNRYVIICSIYMSFVNMYISETPFGPWSAEYSLLSGWHGYGSMVHMEYSTDGGKTVFFSQGPNGPLNMFKVEFGY